MYCTVAGLNLSEPHHHPSREYKLMSKLLNASARELAQPQDVFQKSPYGKTFAGAHVLNLGRMLAQVAIHVNPQASAISVKGFGDESTLRNISADVSGGTLSISAPLPFVAEDSVTRSRSHRGSHFQGNVFGGTVVGKVVRGDMVVSGGNISIGNGSVVMGGGISIINDVVYYDGREVDMNRKIVLVITVPSETSIEMKDNLGNMGVGGELQGELDLELSAAASVYADSVRSLRSRISGSGSIQLGTVHGRTKVKISGSGSLDAHELKGNINASISGSGRIIVSGTQSTSGDVDISISGSGAFTHNGTVDDVDFSISGMGTITIPRATGKVKHSISGMGSAQVNGRSYRPRWQ
jgi:hypothetical protein